MAGKRAPTLAMLPRQHAEARAELARVRAERDKAYAALQWLADYIRAALETKP